MTLWLSFCLANGHYSPSFCRFRYDVLTPGEAQRLAVVRAIYHKPVLLFLDEATSQVDVANEQKIYQLLSEHNITFVTVGHRLSVKQYHSIEIALHGNNRYTIQELD